MPRCRPAFLLVLFALTLPLTLHAQRHDTALSEGEVEKLRDAAYVPTDRVMVFIGFLDTRTKSLESLFAHSRRPGREEDAHDLFEQITEISDELDDNLDDYAHRHQDIRKALPKLIQATERWSTELKTPPDNEAYSVSRKLALESINDIHETATKLLEDQKAWFAAHPPPKENKDAPPSRKTDFLDASRYANRSLFVPTTPHVNLLVIVQSPLIPVFEQQYRDLRPRAPIPQLDIRFRRFTSLNTTIRLREGRLHVRLSDLLEHAPESVHHAIAHILLAKLYKKPIAPIYADRYRRHVRSEAVTKQAEHIRQTRGRKRISTTQGHHYDLDEVFESLNTRFFHGLLGRPTLTWSAHAARRMLGHYDAAHNTIVVSRVFDRPNTPRCAIEYLLYHEMLHLKHPVRVKAGRRCVHSREFQAEERLFPELDAAKAYLKQL